MSFEFALPPLQLIALDPFIGPIQRRCLLDALRGEEQDYFVQVIREFHQRITTMPHTYQQEGKGDQAVVYLHYFAGGRSNWYITEKDKGDGDPRQHQAFGLADLYGDGGEACLKSSPSER